MDNFNFYILLVFVLALFSTVFAQGQEVSYGKTITQIEINNQTQDLYIQSVERISPLRRALWQSPIQNYHMFKELGWGE